jgi:biopolymer transport protein ExbD
MKNRRILSPLISVDHEEPLLNLTPLIDVVFVVLILFILIAPMLEVDKVELAPAAATENRKNVSHPETTSFDIHVREDNSIWVRSNKVSPELLLTFLRKEKAVRPSQVPQLFHDKRAQFGTYQTVKNAVELAGFEELNVILQPGPL